MAPVAKCQLETKMQSLTTACALLVLESWPSRAPCGCQPERVSYFSFLYSYLKTPIIRFYPAVEKQPKKRGSDKSTIRKMVHSWCFEPMCGIVFFSWCHTCTATWQLQWVACWWGVHGWIKRSRLKPQAAQPRLIPSDKVPVRHSREHLFKSLIYSPPLLCYQFMCPLIERTALFRDARAFTQAYNSWQ